MDLKRSVLLFVFLWLLCCSSAVLDCLAQKSPEGTPPPPQFRGVTIQRSGGFAGTQEEWQFSEKGMRWTADGVSVPMPVNKLHRLKDLVGLKWKSRQAQMPPVPVCCDCYTFRITVWYDDGPQIFEVTEATGKADTETSELLGLVRELTRDRPSKP